ncbi:competence protein [Flavobacterium sp. NKUCC04_CG]|uniref:competence protein n=1 Tax=Flavobacterium sp. NKUCC04_CG TaxID=2842121 RepID=UPI001C5BB82D|nr:competence protein [Flavobacterium sp. NKUCC04_CG]MBW3518857.1 competence protein [Flavobacterium sp. NKUCC04_CG]
MAFEEVKEDIRDIKSNAKAYLDSNIEFYQLWGFKVITKATSFMLKLFLLSLFSMLTLLFISIAAAFAIGRSLESFTLGFLIVGGIYLILSLVIYYYKNLIIEKPLIRKFSDIFFND